MGDRIRQWGRGSRRRIEDYVGVKIRQWEREWTRRMWWDGSMLVCGVHNRGGCRAGRVGYRV